MQEYKTFHNHKGFLENPKKNGILLHYNFFYDKNLEHFECCHNLVKLINDEPEVCMAMGYLYRMVKNYGWKSVKLNQDRLKIASRSHLWEEIIKWTNSLKQEHLNLDVFLNEIILYAQLQEQRYITEFKHKLTNILKNKIIEDKSDIMFSEVNGNKLSSVRKIIYLNLLDSLLDSQKLYLPEKEVIKRYLLEDVPQYLKFVINNKNNYLKNKKLHMISERMIGA